MDFDLLDAFAKGTQNMFSITHSILLLVLDTGSVLILEEQASSSVRQLPDLTSQK